MKLRRWCVSVVNEPLQFFWLLKSADRYYWNRGGSAEARARMGLFRWRDGGWRKQAYTLVDAGRTKMWLDEPNTDNMARDLSNTHI